MTKAAGYAVLFALAVACVVGCGHANFEKDVSTGEMEERVSKCVDFSQVEDIIIVKELAASNKTRGFVLKCEVLKPGEEILVQIPAMHGVWSQTIVEAKEIIDVKAYTGAFGRKIWLRPAPADGQIPLPPEDD